MVGSGSATAAWKLQAPSPATARDQVLHERPGPLLEQGDLAGGEDGVEQLAVVAVVGRVDLERDQRPHLADVHGVDARAEHLGVLQHVADLGVAPDDHHPGLTEVHGGGRVAQQLEHRLGVGQRLRVGAGAQHAEVGHRSLPLKSDVSVRS